MSSHRERSPEWYEEILCRAMGYSVLKDWQLEGVIALCSGRDVFLIIATGQGKSFLIQAPIIADRAAGTNSIGIVLVPTKALADDQARASNAKGVAALALHEDSLRAAGKETPPRDLFAEVLSGQWGLVFLSPEMLTTKPFDDLISHPQFLRQLRYFTIDECHLTTEWRSFRTAYGDIARLRNRFPANRVVWLALSATVSKQNLPRLVRDLGFSGDRRRCLIKHLPVDRPTVTYSSRLTQHSTSGSNFVDFAFLATPNPSSPSVVSGFPITIIFAARIEYGERLMTYLTNILPSTLRGEARTRLILPYHSMMSAKYRMEAVEALKSGSQTRMLICTDTGAFGIDIAEIERVVVIVDGPDETFETLCQKIGRIRFKGLAIIYLPGWASLKKQRKSDQRLREKAPPVFIEYANATAEDCPRSINCRYWGEPFVQPTGVLCCNKHHPEIDQHDQHAVEARLKLERSTAPKSQLVRSDGTHHPLAAKTLQPAVYQVLRQWRSTTWCLYSKRSSLCPPNRLISDQLLRHLCKRIHACTTLDKFRMTLAAWDRLDEFGAPLFMLCQKILISTDKLWVPPARRKRKVDEVETAVEGD